MLFLRAKNSNGLYRSLYFRMYLPKIKNLNITQKPPTPSQQLSGSAAAAVAARQHHGSILAAVGSAAVAALRQHGGGGGGGSFEKAILSKYDRVVPIICQCIPGRHPPFFD